LTEGYPNRKSLFARVTRRDGLKLAVLFGGAILLIPVQRLAEFLFPPSGAGPTTYRRTRIANDQDVAVGKSLLFEYPHEDRPAILIHLPDGFVAFDSICTHLGCQVHFDEVAAAGWESNPQQNFCPCHGGVFDPRTGKVLAGPAPRPLPKIKLEVDSQGDIYANGYESGLPLYGEA